MEALESHIATAIAQARAGRPPGPRFTWAETEAAYEAWRFNCGPGAICGLLGLRPEEVRPHMGDFEQRGFTNPTLMYAALTSLGVRFAKTIDSTCIGQKKLGFPEFGLARIQWGGPWCSPKAPPQARYRQTHWVASWLSPKQGHAIFDVNASVWTAEADWKRLVLTDLLELYPRADGTWWVTHALEIAR